MKTRATLGRSLIVALALCCAPGVTRANSNYQTLPHTFTFGPYERVYYAHDWSIVPGMEGFHGTNLVASEGIDPRTVLTDSPTDNPDEYCCILWSFYAGVTVKQGASTWDPYGFPAMRGASSFYSKFAPHLRYYVNAQNRYGIRVAFRLFDPDTLATGGEAVEPYSLQYRTAPGQPWHDVPDAFVADATAPQGQGALLTRRDVLLPPAADGQPQLQVRLLTTDSPGNDEWVGVDSVIVSAMGNSLSAQPDSIGARATAGSNPADGSFTIRNDRLPGYPDFVWEAVPTSGAWLSCLPASGVLASGDSATIALRYSVASFPPGKYSTMVRVFAAGLPTLVVDSVRVTVVVGPEIAVTPASIAFTVPRPGIDSTTITIADLRAGGTSGLNWSLTDETNFSRFDCPWLTESPDHGLVASSTPQAVRVYVNTAGVQRGSYTATVNVASNDVEHPLTTVPVTLLVTQASAVAPSHMRLAVGQSDPRTDSTSLVIGNAGFITPLNWTIDVPLTAASVSRGAGARTEATTCTGVSAPFNSGSIPAGSQITVPLRLDAAGLPLGDTACELHLYSNDPDRPAITISVVFHVGELAYVPGTGSALEWRLDPPRPNPASAVTRVSFALPRASHVELALFDVGGARVRTLAAGAFGAGTHVVACSTAGLGAGLHFVRMSAGAFQTTTRLLVVH